MQYIINLINHYGYIILFISLALELIAFPLPGELMMTYFGFLVYQAQMNWLVSIFIAASGAITGITMSYLIGRGLVPCVHIQVLDYWKYKYWHRSNYGIFH